MKKVKNLFKHTKVKNKSFNIRSNKYIIFKKNKNLFKKNKIVAIQKFSKLENIFFIRIKILSKTIFFLKNYFKLKKNYFKLKKNYLLNNKNFVNSCRYFLNLSFYKIWVLKYKLLRSFFYKTIKSIGATDKFKIKKARAKRKMKESTKKFMKFRKIHRKKVKKFLYRKKIFKKSIIFKSRRKYKRKFKTKKFFFKFFFKFRKYKNNSKILKLKYFLKNNFFLKKILYKNLSSLNYNRALKNRIKRFKLIRRFKFRKRKKRQYKKYKLKLRTWRQAFAFGFNKFITRKRKIKRIIKRSNSFVKFKNKELLSTMYENEHISNDTNHEEDKGMFYLKNLYNLNIYNYDLKKKNNNIHKYDVMRDKVLLTIKNWKLRKKRYKKISKIISKKLNIYYRIQRSVPLRKKMLLFKLVKKSLNSSKLFMNKRLLSKVFIMLKIYKNMIYLLKKKILNFKMKSRVFKNYNFFLKNIKLLKITNSKIISYLKKRILIKPKFKFDNLKKVKLTKKRSIRNVKNKKVIKTNFLKSKKFANFTKKKRKNSNKYSFYDFEKKRISKKLVNFFCLNNFNRAKDNQKIPIIYNIKYFLNKLFLRFTKGGDKSFSKKALFFFLTFLKKKYFINMQINNWLKAYTIQIFLKLVPVFGYMFIKYRRDFLKIPKVFRYSNRSLNNGISISIGWIKKSLLKRVEKTLFLKLVSELESIRINKSDSLKIKKDYYFEIKNNFRKVWRRLKSLR